MMTLLSYLYHCIMFINERKCCFFRLNLIQTCRIAWIHFRVIYGRKVELMLMYCYCEL